LTVSSRIVHSGRDGQQWVSSGHGAIRSFDEGEVLRVVRDQFWSTGYAAARVDDIAAATGLGKGSLYGAFGDKHQLFVPSTTIASG
jgi:hypothetical protein